MDDKIISDCSEQENTEGTDESTPVSDSTPMSDAEPQPDSKITYC